MRRNPGWPIFCLVAACVLAARVEAADLYLSGSLGNSGGFGESSGETDFFDIDGDDSDASPSYGGTFGLSFAIDEALPSIKTFELLQLDRAHRARVPDGARLRAALATVPPSRTTSSRRWTPGRCCRACGWTCRCARRSRGCSGACRCASR